MCDVVCLTGYVTDENGCDTCECVDPCQVNHAIRQFTPCITSLTSQSVQRGTNMTIGTRGWAVTFGTVKTGMSG